MFQTWLKLVLEIFLVKHLKNCSAEAQPTGYATKLEEVSLGKDTMTGHWEIMDLTLQNHLILSLMASLKKS